MNTNIDKETTVNILYVKFPSVLNDKKIYIAS